MRVISRRRRGAATEVTFEDGTLSWYFCGNLIAYKQALSSGSLPLDRTFHGSPPAE